MVKTNCPAVGDNIEVYWPDDKMYYSGRVTAFIDATRRHRVEYSDGDIELLDLRDELWRLPQHSSSSLPQAVTSQHLGAILRAAARPARTVEMKKKRSVIMSPLSVLPPSPLPRQCTSCISATNARALIAQRATRWLRDESRRPSSPVAPPVRAMWVQICADLCVRYVHDSLAIETRDGEECTPPEADLGWLLSTYRGKSASRARQNYSGWKRPLTDDEWRIESDIMRTVARRFDCASLMVGRDMGLSKVQLAQSIAATALRDC